MSLAPARTPPLGRHLRRVAVPRLPRGHLPRASRWPCTIGALGARRSFRYLRGAVARGAQARIGRLQAQVRPEFSVAHRQQPQQREHVRHAGIGQKLQMGQPGLRLGGPGTGDEGPWRPALPGNRVRGAVKCRGRGTWAVGCPGGRFPRPYRRAGTARRRGGAVPGEASSGMPADPYLHAVADLAASCSTGGWPMTSPRAGWGRRTRLSARCLVAVAALSAFVQLAAACGGPAPTVSQRRAGPPTGTPATSLPPLPRRDWAVPGSVIRNLDTAPGSSYQPGEKVVALILHDGPSPVYTPQIVRILAAAGAPASFEIIGMHGGAYPGIPPCGECERHGAGEPHLDPPDLATLGARRWFRAEVG